MAEVIALMDADTLIEGVVFHHDLPARDSAQVNLAMAGLVGELCKEGSASARGFGLVEMSDGRLVKSPYGFYKGNSNKGEKRE